MLNQDKIESELRQFIQENFLIEDKAMSSVTNSDSLPEMGLVDSFGIMEIIRHIEEKYMLTFSESDITLENLASIDSMASFIIRSKNG